MTNSTFDHETLAAKLSREAACFQRDRRQKETIDDTVRTLLVFDLEFRWDREAHAGYVGAEGKTGETDIRWPFDRIGAAAWVVLRFLPGRTVPEIEAPVVLTGEDTSEQTIVARLFAAIEAEPTAIVTTWGGEARDLAVLRCAAVRHDLVLPQQLAELSPYTPQRLDLRAATGVQAARVHLPEYCAASGIPSKPTPSAEIGHLVEAKSWTLVSDQVLADVLATAIVAMRHLASVGYLKCDRNESALALAECALSAFPNSRFVRFAFKPWARDRLRAARLRGTIYRAA